MWFGFILVVLLIVLSLTIYLRKKYNIIADTGIYRPVNNTQKWIELVLLFLILIIIFGFWILDYDGLPLLLFGFLTVLSGLRAFMEYTYEKEDKEYIINLVWAVGYCICFISSVFVV